MDLRIRQTVPDDFPEVYQVIKTAFETAEHSDGDEQNFAVRLREGETYIPKLDLVAVSDGIITGHIMFTRTYVTKPDGSNVITLMVAPLSVLSAYRNKGIGRSLMQEGIRIAKQMGYTSVFLLGNPEYYKRLGFHPAAEYGIRHESFPAQYVQVNEFVPGSLDDVSGYIRF